MTVEKILSKFRDNTMSFDSAFQALSEIGYCPNLLNDDNGYWAVTFDGMQNIRQTDDEDYTGSFYIEAKYWKETIREALIVALEEEE